MKQSFYDKMMNNAFLYIFHNKSINVRTNKWTSGTSDEDS